MSDTPITDLHLLHTEQAYEEMYNENDDIVDYMKPWESLPDWLRVKLAKFRYYQPEQS